MEWRNSLVTYAYPIIGNLPVNEVGQDHVLKILEPIWHIKTEAAKRLRGRIEVILDWAKVKGLREGDNPARWRGHLDKLLPKPSKIRKRQHYPAVPYQNVPQAIIEIGNVKGMSAKALIFTALTAARSNEVLGAKWSEIDYDKRLWSVPMERMKAGKIHRVPLSIQALELLEQIPQFADCEYIFASKKDSKLSNMAMILVMRRLILKSSSGVTAVPHGFRSSFRDWAADCTDFPGDVAEMALAHTITNSTERAYRRGEHAAKAPRTHAAVGRLLLPDCCLATLTRTGRPFFQASREC